MSRTTNGEVVFLGSLDDWEAKVREFLADLKARVDDLREVAPQTPEEQLDVFLVKQRVVDTLVDRIQIDRERNLQVQIRLRFSTLSEKMLEVNLILRHIPGRPKFIAVHQIYTPRDQS